MKTKEYKNENYHLHKKQRKTWKMNPVERVVDNKQVISKLSSKEILEMIDDYVSWYNDIDAIDIAG